MIYINTTGKQNQVWLPKPYDIVINDCPEAEDAWNSGHTSGYTDGYGDGWDSGYTSGYTDGINSCSGGSCEGIWEEGYESGYTDGSASVDCSDYYDSGYTDGHSSGVTEGEAAQKAKLVATAVTQNGTYSREDGFSSIEVDVPSMSGAGYSSGYTDGYASGVTAQKNKLASTAFTENRTYTRADGWSSVTVNVSGYSKADLDAAYASGYSAGYDSGVTDGCEACSPKSATSITLLNPAGNNSYYTFEPGMSGATSVVVVPSGAVVDLTYSSSDPTKVAVDENGVIYASGVVWDDVNICVKDNNTNLQSCFPATVVYTPLVFNFNSSNCPCNDDPETMLREYICECVPASGGTWDVTYGLTHPWDYVITEVNVTHKPSWVTVSPSAITENISYQTIHLTFAPCTEIASGDDQTRTDYLELTENGVSANSITMPLSQYKKEPIPGVSGAIYYVSSTTEPTSILCATTGIAAAVYSGNNITIDTGYTFPATGYQVIDYTYSDNTVATRTFQNVDSLVKIVIPEGVTTMGEHTVCYCDNLEEVVLPNSLTGTLLCFGINPKLVSINIPTGITEIGQACFDTCRLLPSITIPYGVTTLGKLAFNECCSLSSITIPASVNSIGSSCFRNCSGLTSMTFEGTTPPSFVTTSAGSEWLGQYDYTFPIYVPASAVETYKAAPNWDNYASRIQANPNE